MHLAKGGSAMRLPCVILTILLRHAQKKLAEENDQAKRHEAQVRSDPAYLNDLASRHNIRKKQLQQHIQDGNDWKRVCGQRDGLLPFIFLDTYNDFKIGKEQWLELGRQNDTGPSELSGYWDKERRVTEENLKDIYRFVSSFDTLICLDIHDYNTYLSNVESNPGLLLPLEQSILKHNELEELHFHHKDAFSGHELPCFAAASVEALLKNLPKLRVLELAPSGDSKDEMLRALSRAKNLTTLIFNHEQTLYPRSDFGEDHHTMVVKGLLEGFMEYASCPGEFI
ncbi:hypothetical protein FOTG_17428 [Fusarium oxysporum f. sp. vasinfectum 25433]|uniref:Uncharacterized protein n=1 Tax=Fusarium oxysporum f. sp. vasinfectum 25433 TaxID=1089449 RepID=X0KKJ9_FUSOX|nr:hypothetical protein FOTG_17428 [Fusarium oxysporum f. sp. vasinfectum 25433]